jgi:hypothetical protein
VRQLDGAGRLGEHARRRRFLHDGAEVEQGEHALRANPCLLAAGEHAREQTNRRQELQQIAEEGEKDAEAELLLKREPATERKHTELRQRRQSLQRRRVVRRQPRGA